jgi:hypothetical protein
VKEVVGVCVGVNESDNVLETEGEIDIVVQNVGVNVVVVEVDGVGDTEGEGVADRVLVKLGECVGDDVTVVERVEEGVDV